jgi:hypothetical protein
MVIIASKALSPSGRPIPTHVLPLKLSHPISSGYLEMEGTIKLRRSRVYAYSFISRVTWLFLSDACGSERRMFYFRRSLSFSRFRNQR